MALTIAPSANAWSMDVMWPSGVTRDFFAASVTVNITAWTLGLQNFIRVKAT